MIKKNFIYLFVLGRKNFAACTYAESETFGNVSKLTNWYRINPVDWEKVEGLIKLDWNPEQISGDLGKEGILSISHEWIYQHIYRDKRDGGSLWKHLRCQKTLW